ncbi:hypothetical protein IQ07DRAFT_632853 [Pyrenochaeta sp. DS3sAY3a]|nr:hypothetical protein IQ07DRAFT_632853 [Pyrenochaeta sp. DS3sAY3a]
MVVEPSHYNLPEVSYSQEPEVQPSSLPQFAPGKAIQYEQPPAHPQPAAKPKILGLQRQTFLLVLVLVVVIIAATVGGGVGGSLAVQNARTKASSLGQTTTIISVFPSSSQGSASITDILSTSATSSAPSSSVSVYYPPAPSLVALVNSSCPASGKITVEVLDEFATYSCTEKTDFIGNDITGLVAYTLVQCLEACGQANRVQGGGTCVAVVHSPMLNIQYARFGANCFLKKATAPQRPNDEWNVAILQEE